MSVCTGTLTVTDFPRHKYPVKSINMIIPSPIHIPSWPVSQGGGKEASYFLFRQEVTKALPVEF